MKPVFTKHFLITTTCLAAAAFLSGCYSRGNADNYSGLLNSRGILPPARSLTGMQISRTSQKQKTTPATTVKDNTDIFQYNIESTPISIPGPMDDSPIIIVENPDYFQPANRKYNRPMPIAPDNGNIPSAGIRGKGDGAAKIYVVKQGDVLSRIAKSHQVTMAEIRDLNPALKNSDKIMIGQKLKMPSKAVGDDFLAQDTKKSTAKSGSTAKSSKNIAKQPIPADGTYTAVHGDSLWLIAHKFGISQADLRSWNNLTSDKIQIGQQFKLRANATVAGSTAKKSSATTKPKQQEKTGTQAPVSTPRQNDKIQPSDDGLVDIPQDIEGPSPNLDDIFQSSERTYKSPSYVATSGNTEKIGHSILPGDTLETIADIYNVTPEEILKWNPNIRDDQDLTPGASLYIYNNIN